MPSSWNSGISGSSSKKRWRFHVVDLGMLLIILIMLIVLALGGGGWGYSRYGLAGWSPLGVLLLVLVVLWLSGNLHH